MHLYCVSVLNLGFVLTALALFQTPLVIQQAQKPCVVSVLDAFQAPSPAS
jgi:hypothetical protein